MSRDSSPPPLSDDSAIGSLTEKPVSSTTIPQPTVIPPFRPKLTRPSRKDLIVNSEDLEQAAKQMRTNNVSLISCSVRTNLSCFEDLDVQRFESRTDYLINFRSNGIKKCNSTVLRPVSILWPDYYEGMVEKLSILDAFLLNTEFREKPVEWMLERGLTTIPTCRICNTKMGLKCEKNIVRWQCQKTQACTNYFMPVERPSFFSSYEKVGLDKLLYSVYYWSTCIPGEELYTKMTIQPHILDIIWRRIQNVCRTALEKSYPRHRLTNVLDRGANQQDKPEPIDLVSIKLNDVYVVCAKHPASNLVRLGLYIPNVSLYSFVDLTESWFAHGAHVRVSESKFLGLNKRRTDLNVSLVSRLEMVSRKGHFHKNSAFGYIICQLAHVLKDYDSMTLSRESLKLTLAEMQWRELYGTTPFDAFTNIVNHMAQFGEASDWYSEPSLPVSGEETLGKPDSQMEMHEQSEFIWTERYYYASIEPVDSDGKLICRYSETPDDPPPDVRVSCHECNLPFECFDLSLHLISHIETKRKDCDGLSLKKQSIECKHCFKIFSREDLMAHSTLFRAKFQTVQFGCRICCIRLNDRATFLQHMRQTHFEHETPYRCPSCKFSSSFQKDVLIHFQEEHRHSMIILCPLCLRSFTVAKPETMTPEKMQDLSKIVYNHLAEHYATGNGFTCSNCCLCFLNKEAMQRHKNLHHNPLEIKPKTNDVKLLPFIVDSCEEKFCVKALQMELFIANKRPNRPHEAISSELETKHKPEEVNNNPNCRITSSGRRSSSSSDSDSSEVDCSDEDGSGLAPSRRSSSPAKSDTDSYSTAPEDGIVYVRDPTDSKRFLEGGSALLQVPRGSIARATKDNNSARPKIITSQKLVDYLSKMNRADGVIANRSVILTPVGKPAKCSECLQYITIDHFVSLIGCDRCKYVTFCPRAATFHKAKHSDGAA